MRIGTREGQREREREARGRGEGAARAAPWLCRSADSSQRIKLALGRTRNSHDWNVIETAPGVGRRVGGVVVRRARKTDGGEERWREKRFGKTGFLELGRTHAAFSPSTLLLASNFWQAAQGRLLLTAGGARPIRQHSAGGPNPLALTLGPQAPGPIAVGMTSRALSVRPISAGWLVEAKIELCAAAAQVAGRACAEFRAGGPWTREKWEILRSMAKNCLGKNDEELPVRMRPASVEVCSPRAERWHFIEGKERMESQMLSR